MTDIRIDFCCNDPDNGNFSGRCLGIQLPDDLAELEALNWDKGIVLRIEESRIFLAGKAWPYTWRKDWFGNWCWNAFWLEEQVAVNFMAWLHKRRLFSMSCGDSRLFNIWKKDKDFSADDRDFIHRLMVESMFAKGQ